MRRLRQDRPRGNRKSSALRGETALETRVRDAQKGARRARHASACDERERGRRERLEL